jgi:hypothetical protein
MNDPAAVVMVVASSCAAAAYSIRVIANAVLRHKEMENRRESLEAVSYSDDRIARIEIAVESIALEVERISEGQRFTTRLLDQVAQVSAPRLEKPAKMNTPH